MSAAVALQRAGKLVSDDTWDVRGHGSVVDEMGSYI